MFRTRLNSTVFSFTGDKSAYENLVDFVNSYGIKKEDIQYISEMVNGSLRMLWWSHE